METKQEFKMIPVQTKSLDHIRCDSKGNVLCVNDKNQFFFNGEKVYEGRYLYFDLHNGNYAISKEENENEVIYLNGKRVYTLKEEDLVFKEKMFYQFQMEDVPLYWRVLNGKLVTIEKECLYYDGKLLLKENQFDDYRVIGDKLFVEKNDFPNKEFEVNISDGSLTPVKSIRINDIREDGQGKFLFACSDMIFINGKLIIHVEKYLRQLGKGGYLYHFDWHKGVFAFEVETEVKGKFRDTQKHSLYIEGKLVYEVSNWLDWYLVNGKLLLFQDGVILYDGKKLFEQEERDECEIINHHLFIRKGKKFYQVLLPE